MKRKILVLGGGRHQIELLKYIESQGIETVLSDYLPESPGHTISSHPTLTSTLDFESNLELAKKHNIDGIITMGTDQPLNTMAKVAEKMSLPCYLSPLSAQLCTHKGKMFECLSNEGCHLPKYIKFSGNEIDRSQIENFEFPLIIKPVDSQGQRGISIIHDKESLDSALSDALNNSKVGFCIVQEYISGPELTISAWVHEGQVHILLITDRVTYNTDDAIGVCLQHVYPCTHDNIYPLAEELSKKVSRAYKVNNGPLYIQCILNNSRLSIVEATCRIGGGHEDKLIKEITGLDIYPMLMDLALYGRSKETPKVEAFPIKEKYALINFLLANEGTIRSAKFDDQTHKTNLLDSGFYYGLGYTQEKIVDSMGRIGFFLCSDTSKQNLLEKSYEIYNAVEVLDDEDLNMVFWPDKKYVNK